MLARIRNWLRSDMKVLRWVFLAVYLLLCAELLSHFGDIALFAIVPPVYFGTQALFIFGGGTKNFCEPIEPHRLWMPVAVSSYALTQVTAVLAAILVVLLHCPYFGKLPMGRLERLGAAGWPLWGALLWFLVRRRSRRSALARLAGILFVCCLLEFSRRVASRLVWLHTIREPMSGLVVIREIVGESDEMLYAFGPMLALLFLRPRYRRELMERAITSCPACGYDLRGTLVANIRTCPECGAMAPDNAVALPLE